MISMLVETKSSNLLPESCNEVVAKDSRMALMCQLQEYECFNKAVE